MPTFAFAWEEVDESPVEQLGPDGFRPLRRFKVPWGNRWDFAVGLAGTPGRSGASLPAGYPGAPHVRAARFEIKPFPVNPSGGTLSDPATELASHEHALVEVTYEPAQIPSGEAIEWTPQDFELPEGTWASYEQRFSGEFVTLPSRGLFWESDGEPVPPDVHPAVTIPLTDHVVTWHHVPAPPWAAISRLRGQVNDAALAIPVTRHLCGAETLLFMGADAATEFSLNPFALISWRLTYTFRERAVQALGEDAAAESAKGWNHQFNPQADAWDRAININGDPLYTTGGFAALFAFAAL